jgi:hypothetical protein
MATGARLPVKPPSFTLPPYGLLTAVDMRSGSDPHWQAGVEWQTVCGGGGSTYDTCVWLNATTGLVITGAVPKSATADTSTWGATPFTVFEEIDCSPVGFYEESEKKVREALLRNEQYQVERIFWTGTVGGRSPAQYPHLAATETVAATEASGFTVTLQNATTVITGTGLCAQAALGQLEDAFADCYRGVGVIHVPLALIPYLDEAYLLHREGNRLVTTNGNTVVAGSGYPGTSAAGAVTAGALWMFMTPPIFAYRGDVRVFPQESTLDRSVNTVKAIAERTYLLGYDCCLVAVAVSTECL